MNGSFSSATYHARSVSACAIRLGHGLARARMRFASVQDQVLATAWTVPRVLVVVTVGGSWEEGAGSHPLASCRTIPYGWERGVFFFPSHPCRGESLVFHVLLRWVRALWMGSVLHGSSPTWSGGPYVSGSHPKQWFLLSYDGWRYDPWMGSPFLFSSLPPNHTSMPSLLLSRFPTKETGTCGIHPHRIPWSLFASLCLSLSAGVWLGGTGVFPMPWVCPSFVDHKRTQTRATIPTCVPTTRLRNRRRSNEPHAWTSIPLDRRRKGKKTNERRERKTSI